MKIAVSIILLILGWLMTGIGYTTKMGHPISTSLFLGGILLSILSLIWFIILISSTLKSKRD